MAALELHDTEGRVLKENIQRAIEGLEQPLQKVKCERRILWVLYVFSVHCSPFQAVTGKNLLSLTSPITA